MATVPNNNESQEVPVKVFETFLKTLEEAGEPSSLIARFRKTLLEDTVFTETALKEAVFSEEQTP